ncbi:putative 2-aminoethylphosphonate ABC transporter permease subunit [Roseateles chitinivorans]|uniref:Putative 2-aminoethylphosphonate ABC transporter permease subunit n=1 Tax=Roseateles chitinivorans TaxID=2917965 RepID=A0A2G9C4N5_9BURK|nr:putative 2-aminoethylphosphonate ABC transporter permease subunit [Roseateles chitinivorans]
MSSGDAPVREGPFSRDAGDGLARRRSVEGAVLRALLAAALLVLTLILLLPLASLLAQSVLDGHGRFVGLAHFAAYFSTGRWSALWHSVTLSAVSAVVCVVLAYGYAWALTHTALPARALWRALALLPLLAPSLLAAIGLVYAFGNQGLLKAAMQAVGVDSIYGPAGIVLGSVLWTFPHAMLILVTTLSASDARTLEAARCLGANGWRVFRTVTLPASRYGLLISLVVVFVLVLTDFGVPKVVGGQTPMLATDIYKEVVGQQRLDRGAVVALLLLLPALGAFAVEQRLRARQRAVLSLRAVPHRPTPHRPRDLAALLYCGVVAAALVGVFGIAVYASFAQYWPYQLAPTLSHYQFDMSDGGGWASYWNSLRMAAWTAALGAALSFLVAWLVDKPRGHRAARGLLNALATLPMAVPGLALGLGYILFFNAPWNPLRGWYGGLGLLVLCTVAHYYSVAHLTQLGALRQLDAEYERVAESLGLPFWTHLRRVHLPIAVPTLVQVAGYFFVSALTTVSAVVFLYSPDTALAAVAVLAMDDAGDTAPAAAMATLLFATAALGRGVIGLIGHVLVQRTQRWRAR